MLQQLTNRINNCTTCEAHLSLGVNPIFSIHEKSKIVIIGQAPGQVVHKSGVPWEDKSGDNLRSWMGINKATFYNTSNIALIPMGFCYPGKGKSGDLPPRPECAPQWHEQILAAMDHIELILLVGKYAQDYYLGEESKKTLTETVRNHKMYLPKYFVLPHPSPRNNIWRARNPWFDEQILPLLKHRIGTLLEP